jgi:hypothetical protein
MTSMFFATNAFKIPIERLGLFSTFNQSSKCFL